MQHFYDAQIRRYITQMIRMMSGFSYKDGQGRLKTVPVMYGDLTRQAANIIRDNSENKIPSAPRMSVYITGLEMDRTRTGDSTLVSKMHIRERAYDANGQEYLNEEGKNYTVERLMPSPYILRMNVDIWASNTDQKLQIVEQILTLFNPSLEIQTTDNYIDWTSLSVVDLDGITWSTRSIPVGVDSEIDVAQLQFSTPIYISPPVKVKRLGVITNIITRVFDERTGDINLGLSGPEMLAYSENQLPMDFETETQVNENGEIDIVTKNTIDYTFANQSNLSTTFRDYGVYVLGNEAQIIYDGKVGEVDWDRVILAYPGTYQAGLSKIVLKNSSDPDSNIIGYITVNSLDNTKVLVSWDQDTLPSDTIIQGPIRNNGSIDYIIDTTRFDPSQDKTAGVRLLLITSIGDTVNIDGPDAWKNNDVTDFVADENDIVEWDGANWNIIFDASETTDVTYVSNLNTGVQYKWTGSLWIQSYEGEYSEGAWMLYLES